MAEISRPVPYTILWRRPFRFFFGRHLRATILDCYISLKSLQKKLVLMRVVDMCNLLLIWILTLQYKHCESPLSSLAYSFGALNNKYCIASVTNKFCLNYLQEDILERRIHDQKIKIYGFKFSLKLRHTRFISSYLTTKTTNAWHTKILHQNSITSAAIGKFRWEWIIIIPSSAKAKSVWPFQQYLSSLSFLSSLKS